MQNDWSLSLHDDPQHFFRPFSRDLSFYIVVCMHCIIVKQEKSGGSVEFSGARNFVNYAEIF